jgi:hypothetical protein
MERTMTIRFKINTSDKKKTKTSINAYAAKYITLPPRGGVEKAF